MERTSERRLAVSPRNEGQCRKADTSNGRFEVSPRTGRDNRSLGIVAICYDCFHRVSWYKLRRHAKGYATFSLRSSITESQATQRPQCPLADWVQSLP
jgi:hypothetical protein